jgi:predicted nucleotidyltransferase
MQTTKHLYKKNLITPPKWLPDNVHYETMMGSVAYGVSNDTSDMDIYGFCMPPKDLVFPHLTGAIYNFDMPTTFEQYQQHHIEDKESNKLYDINIYNIVNYFRLLQDCNPNMIDSIFTPHRCVLSITKVGTLVRENRNIFLHKGAWHRFKGYAYSQLAKAKSKNPEGKRKEIVAKYGWDVKFGYHIVRLLDEVEQILTEHTIDLERNREQLKAIRRGEWSLEQMELYFSDKEKQLEKAYLESTLQNYPDKEAIKSLLLNCLEEHYGNLNGIIVRKTNAEKKLEEIKTLLERTT